MTNRLLLAACVTTLVGVGSTLTAQRSQSAAPARSAAPAVDVSAALKSGTPDLDRRLARSKPVKMPYNRAGLNAREQRLVDELVVALQKLESIYWRQSDPEAMALYKALGPTSNGRQATAPAAEAQLA